MRMICVVPISASHHIITLPPSACPHSSQRIGIGQLFDSSIVSTTLCPSPLLAVRLSSLCSTPPAQHASSRARPQSESCLPPSSAILTPSQWHYLQELSLPAVSSCADANAKRETGRKAQYGNIAAAKVSYQQPSTAYLTAIQSQSTHPSSVSVSPLALVSPVRR